MSKEKFKRKIRRAAAAIAALALAVSFTFPTGTDIMGVSFGNAIVASATEVANGTCGNGVTWTLDDNGTLTISYTGFGSGAMTDWYSPYSVPWYDSYRGSIKTVAIEQGVTSIGNYAFFECSYIESISIEGSVTSIGDYAFDSCSALTSITIPDSVTSIGNIAFTNCSSLTSIYVDDHNQNYCSVDGVLFSKDKNTLIAYPANKSGASYVIPDSVNSIEDSAFEFCHSLTSITIPDSVTSIGDNAFAHCSSLTSITIPNGVNSIENHAFDGCDSLTSITIPEGVTSIGSYAFYQCDSLTSIFLPESLTSIGTNAIPAAAAQIKYTVSANEVTITEMTNVSEGQKVDIPEKISGYPVVSVAEAYQNYVGNHTHYFSNNICGLCSGIKYVTGITVSPDTLSLTVGYPASQLTATAEPANAVDKSVEWTSSDTAVATVDDSGNVTAVGKGTATIK
ncbi:MAG: leucine-rich repeat protein, partial [Huintestinicola sp.]